MSSTQHQLIEQCATRLRGIVEALDNIHDNTPQRWSTDLDDVHSSAESLLAMIKDQAPPSEDQLIAAGLSYPLAKEDAVKLWYAGFRSEVVTVLEAWEAIGHDTGINPDKEELLESLRNMAAICNAHGNDMPAQSAIDQRQVIADAITGALAFGAQASQPPAADHWLRPFYDIGRAEGQRTQDLAMLVRMLASSLKRHAPESNLVARATNYLAAKGLAGTPLRDPPAPVEQAEPASCQGTNCGTTTGDHSSECIAEAAASQGWELKPGDLCGRDCPMRPAPVEQAGGDERVIGWRERILAAHPNSDPGFWPDALLVEHMAAEIADLRAALTQPSPTLPPFAEKVLAKLRRFNDCAGDFESGGVDIGRHWLDLLTQLGLLNRAQRSPALWEISQQGDDLLEGQAAQAGQVPQAWLDVQAERRRQIEAEGWTPEHDDAHSYGQMARAAACYALAGSSAPNDGTAALLVSLAWPWDEQWWKPSTARRDMVKACALGLAEIERLDRVAASQGGPSDA
ncbi:hypothetical protein [Pseudomonas aeruginosa]|uniref:hypothetical protein n=1 Tax=Pseudomonas aeruginosa TaxID=287 RepID=UPI00300C273A